MELKEDEREYLINTADTLAFVDEKKVKDKFRCANCEVLAIQHNSANCKHVFCSKCIKKLLHEMCPVCRNVKITEVSKDDQFEKELLDLIVECQYKRNGCKERMSLRKYQEHVKNCSLSTKTLLPKVYRGPEKNEKFEDWMMLAVKEIGDKMQIIINDVEKLKNQNQTFGKLKLNNLETEISLRVFKKEITKKVNACETKLGELCTRISHIENIHVFAGQVLDTDFQDQDDDNLCNNVSKNPVFIWKVPGFLKLWEPYKHKQYNILKSHPFQNTELGLEFCASLKCDPESDLAINLTGYKCNPTYGFARKFTLVDQSDSDEKKHVSFIDTPLFKKNSAEQLMKEYFHLTVLAPKGLLEKDYERYVRDDSMIIKISLIPLSLMYKSVTSNNGVLLWRIDNYSKKKEDEIGGSRHCLTSNSFYTAPQGYRVQAFLFLNGHDKSKETHVSIYIVFIVGEFDYMLPRPFSGMAKFVLLDQSDSLDKHNVCSEIMFQYTTESRWEGRHDFLLPSTVEVPRYLKDDSLLFKIVVKVF